MLMTSRLIWTHTHTHTLSLSQDSFLILLERQMRANLVLVKG